jgi:hypothetical protein
VQAVSHKATKMCSSIRMFELVKNGAQHRVILKLLKGRFKRM